MALDMKARVVGWIQLGICVFLLSKAAISEKAYPFGCSQKPTSYYDYESRSFPPNTLHVHSVDDFALTRRLGTGKFSDVFEAVDINAERRIGSNKPPTVVDPRTLVVIKCLKPVAERKIRREILVLERAAQLPNIVKLLALVVPPEYYGTHRRRSTDLPRMPSLVMQHAGPDAQWFCHGVAKGRGQSQQPQADAVLTDYEIRYYLFHLLVALDALHAAGMMHRDVKPRNVLINRRFRDGVHRNPLTLIDLGLADFYHPSLQYNVKVASRHYKAPELLLCYGYYDYSVDMWGVGCILVGLLFHREPFFRGRDNVDQLHKVVEILGATDMWAYIKKYQIELSPALQQELHSRYGQGSGTSYQSTRINWKTYFEEKQLMEVDSGEKSKPAPPPQDALDLLSRLLVYDHEERLTASQAMQHPFFDPVRHRVQAEVRSYHSPVFSNPMPTSTTPAY